jgi:hypothetical protein
MRRGKPICGKARKGTAEKRRRLPMPITKVGWPDPRKSDFCIGDRVQISTLGASRCPRLSNKTGTIVGRSIYNNRIEMTTAANVQSTRSRQSKLGSSLNPIELDGTL